MKSHLIFEPAHAQALELVIEEILAELGCQQGNVLDDGEPHTPMSVLRELHNGRKERVRELIHADHLQTQLTGGSHGSKMRRGKDRGNGFISASPKLSSRCTQPSRKEWH